MRITKKKIGAGLAVAAIAMTGAASTASNTVAAGAGRLGFSKTTVTGGTINAINYTLDDTFPGKVTFVKINVDDLTPLPTVRVQLEADPTPDISTTTLPGDPADPDVRTVVITCVMGTANAAVVEDLLAVPPVVGVAANHDYDCTIPVGGSDPVIAADKLKNTYVAIS